ncbi:MAG: beta-galactosidase [Planctomycetota bacterium]|nr:beta-galactosidase [Planctomycetota bacterium]
MEPARMQLVEDFDGTWKEGRWQFSDGREFPGAKGSFERSKEGAHSGEFGGKLSFDFAGGGNYVAAILNLTGAPDIKAVRVWLKNPAGNRLTFRYTDPGGQTLQKAVPLPPHGDWAETEIECSNWSGHWGGANDGIVHGPPTHIAILVETDGKKQGSLFFDDIRLVEGKPIVPVWTYTAASFEPDERWHAYGDGKGAKTKLSARKWQFDFAKGGEWVAISPREFSLLGTPKRIRIRFRGDLGGHAMRLRFATHFMTFERNLGPATPVKDGQDGEQEIVTHAPPGEGWHWFDGENDGKLHGPLRIAGLFIDAGGKRDAGEIELAGITVDAECSARRLCLVLPDQEVPVVQAYYVAPLPAAEDTAQLDPASPFGMGLYLYRYPGDAKGLREMDQAAKMGATAGVKWSREEIAWAHIEPAQGKFNWTFYDKVVATAKRNGISIYGLLDYWTGWTKPYTPEGIADYCRFVTAVVEHYRNDIQYWEIWNEPNIFFWQGPRDMYAELLKQAYAAVKKADPNAKVLGCSTAGIDYGFIKRTMELGAPFDILTIHPYRGHLDDRAFVNDLKKVADLVKNPDGSPRQAWITEMGWATHVPHNSMRMDFNVTPQRKQAELLARAYIGAIASGVAPNISWYDFRNDGTDPLNFEHNMGIITRDFRPKPAYRAYATMTRMLKGLKADKPLDLDPGVVAWRFGKADARNVVCLWSISGDKAVAVPAAKPMVLTGLMGDAETLTPAAGNVTVPLRGEAPVFLTEPPE